MGWLYELSDEASGESFARQAWGWQFSACLPISKCNMTNQQNEAEKKKKKEALESEKRRETIVSGISPYRLLSFSFCSLHKVLEFVQQALDESTVIYAGADDCVKQCGFSLI